MDLKRKGIKDIFTKLGKKGFDIWFSGVKGEGEYKSWHDNGQLYIHSFYNKNGELDGEYKYWYENGQMWQHAFYKDNKQDGEYKLLYPDGRLNLHAFYKDGKMVKKII